MQYFYFECCEKCSSSRFSRLQIQYASGCNQTVNGFEYDTAVEDTFTPGGDIRRPAGSLHGTGLLKGTAPSSATPPLTATRGVDLSGGRQPPSRWSSAPFPSALRSPGRATILQEGIPAWDQGTAGGGMKSRGRHPKYCSRLHSTYSTEGSKPCRRDGCSAYACCGQPRYSPECGEDIPPSGDPLARCPMKPRLLT